MQKTTRRERRQKRKKDGNLSRKNKAAERLKKRLDGYNEICKNTGYTGTGQHAGLPRRWRGYTKPGRP